MHVRGNIDLFKESVAVFDLLYTLVCTGTLLLFSLALASSGYLLKKNAKRKGRLLYNMKVAIYPISELGLLILLLVEDAVVFFVN